MLSKYAWVETLKNKTEVAVTRAMQTILIRARPTPQKLQTDAGKEFYNRTFQMKTHDIHHFSTHGDAKAAVAERFNRTSVHGSQEHAGILRGLTEYRARMQRHRASEHWRSSKRPDAKANLTILICRKSVVQIPLPTTDETNS